MLNVKIGKIGFDNPIMVASGTYGYGNEVMGIANVNGLGGIVTKSVTLNPREGNPPPRIHETSSGMLNSIGLANVGVDSYIKDKLPYLNELNTKIIINIAGSSIDEYITVLEKLEESEGRHVGYEINISCPNVKKGGMEFGVDPQMTEKLTAEIRSMTQKLVIMKLSPNVTSIVDIAKAAEIGGADAVSAINTVVGSGIDIKSRKPVIHTTFGGLSGPAIKPIAIANVLKVSRSVIIPVIGIGGISCTNDVIEFIMAGATMVQLGTINYTHPNLGESIINELTAWLHHANLNHIVDVIGVAEDF